VSDHKELAALKRCVDDEKMENLHLEKVNAELQRQLEEQKKALKALEAQRNVHQEQLKDQKKAHQGKPLLPSSTCTERLILDSEKLSTTELKRVLMSKEELLTDVKNLLYRRTDDVERLQKVIGDTERQFVDGLQRIKTLGEGLEDLRGAARELVDMVDPPEEGGANPRPLLEQLREAPKSIHIPFRGSCHMRQQRPRDYEVLPAKHTAGDICSRNGGGLHRGSV
jgi:hypothetical protein